MESARADVLIETLRVEADGCIALWPWHAARLTQSAAALRFPPPPAAKTLLAMIKQHTTPSQTSRVRLLYNRLGRIEIQAFALAPLDLPAKVRLAADIFDTPALDATEPLLRHKTTYRPWYAPASDWLAAHPDYFDLLFTNSHGELCEGTRTNIYALIDGVWLTPDLAAGCLPGTQRAALLDAGKVQLARLTPADLGRAQGLRLSNGLRGWFDGVLD